MCDTFPLHTPPPIYLNSEIFNHRSDENFLNIYGGAFAGLRFRLHVQLFLSLIQSASLRFS